MKAQFDLEEERENNDHEKKEGEGETPKRQKEKEKKSIFNEHLHAWLKENKFITDSFQSPMICWKTCT